MKRASWAIRIVACLMVLTLNVYACLWDTDTLATERLKFPETLELITGKFLRHSREFYEWRIQDRLTQMGSGDPAAGLYDDLAVAYEKTGQTQKAIELMLEKEAAFPSLYETYANLGTFYIHGGDYERGLEFLGKAVQINPNAHFGREVYQQYLVQYVQARTENGVLKLPLRPMEARLIEMIGFVPARGFAEFVLQKRTAEGSLADQRDMKRVAEEVRAATKGILGMMRFGNHESPLLLEALGDLLRTGHAGQNANLLAARAYLKASYAVSDPAIQAEYRAKAQWAVGQHNNTKLPGLEVQFKRELAAAEVWWKRVHDDELRWIGQGKNVDAEFAQKYYSPEPRRPTSAKKAKSTRSSP